MEIENWKKIGFTNIHFNEHLRENLFYPTIQLGENKYKVVPIDFTIDTNGEILQIEYSKTPTALNKKYQYTPVHGLLGRQ